MQKVKVLGIFGGLFNTWQKFEPTRVNFYCFGQMFIVVNDQILNKKIIHLVTLVWNRVGLWIELQSAHAMEIFGRRR